MADSVFDQALELAQQWPGEKSIPAELARLYVETDGHPDVARFIEALYAAAEDPGDLELIESAFPFLDSE